MVNLIFIYTFFILATFGIEDYIGMNISDIPFQYQEFNSEKDSGDKTFVIPDCSISFFSNKIELMIVITDKENIIKSISTDFNMIMDKALFDEISKKYGAPKNMNKIKEISSEQSGILESDTTFKSIGGTMEECEFDEKPLFIKWSKANFQMIFTLNHEANKTELTIRKLTE